MNTSLLVVPALAGYWVLSRTYITHFIVDRHVGYRFIFETAVVGLAILVVAQIIVVAAGWQDAELKWLPFEHAATLTVMVAIALCIPPVVNQFIPADMAAARRAVVDESRFGWLLRESLEKGLLVEISTTTRKSWCVGLRDPLRTSPQEGDICPILVIERLLILRGARRKVGQLGP